MPDVGGNVAEPAFSVPPLMIFWRACIGKSTRNPLSPNCSPMSMYATTAHSNVMQSIWDRRLQFCGNVMLEHHLHSWH